MVLINCETLTKQMNRNYSQQNSSKLILKANQNETKSKLTETNRSKIKQNKMK